MATSEAEAVMKRRGRIERVNAQSKHRGLVSMLVRWPRGPRYPIAELRPASVLLEKDLRPLVKERGLVVWLDKEGAIAAGDRR
jgi:hypothetical protein